MKAHGWAAFPLALGAILLFAARGPGAEKPQGVTFETTDGVEIHGTFYPGPKGRAGATVLLLRDAGKHGGEEQWVELARGMHKQGYAVLAFDFRGHGESTAVDERFWAVPVNWQKAKGRGRTKASKQIASRDFSADYYPTLANDIAAARAFLDERNDRGECNSGNLIVVGAGEGANLGALWLATECCRHQLSGRLALRLHPTPEAEGVRGVVWMNLDSTIAGRRVPVVDWVEAAGRDHKIPTGLLYSRKNRAAADTAAKCSSALKSKKADGPLTDSRAVDGAAEERGDLVGEFVRAVFKARAMGEWEERDFEDRTFVWTAPRRPRMVAKVEGAKTLALLPVEWFLGR